MEARQIKNSGSRRRLIVKVKECVSNSRSNVRKILTRLQSAPSRWITSKNPNPEKRKDNRRRILESAALGSLFIACAAFINPPYKLLYNPSESAPIGWYVFTRSQRIYVGEYVLVTLPEAPATLANDRGYLPRSMPILKHVGAVTGQEVCRQDDQILIDGILITHAFKRDGLGRALPRWSGCRKLSADEIFLLSTENPLSFDGRYFGPVPTSAILGEALPLWTR